MTARPILLIADPQDNRVAFFQEALAEHGLPYAEVLSYLEVIEQPAFVAERAARDAVVRIESPGRCLTVYRALLERGADEALQEGGPALSRDEIATLPQDRGMILFPRQWYLGLRATLDDIHSALVSRSDVAVTIDPRAVSVMFCKRQCHALLRESGVPVPPALAPVVGFDELITAMAQAHMPRVFIKLRHGSAASGVVALAVAGNRLLACTTVEMSGDISHPRLYNTRRIRHLTETDQVRLLVDAVCRHGVHVERWVPKASVEGRICDLRMVVINGDPSHAVLRLSRNPITNLHLGNVRQSALPLRERMTTAAWESLEETCRRVAAIFGQPLQVSLDIAVSPDYRRHYVLEVNAFGDLLKGVMAGGRSTYGAQVLALATGWSTCEVFRR
ncbi:MAG: STM4014 family protein [Armatimonadota bacterium]